ncbi:MAG: DUF6175 family protein [Gemmatimonadales bacterium]|nr:DUF6175 family protein [Gemmatimonadales bacterium]
MRILAFAILALAPAGAAPLLAQRVPPATRPSGVTPGTARPGTATPGSVTPGSVGPAAAGGVATVQPKIMVVPFTKQGEDIRTLLESDIRKRLAIAEIKNAFDQRGATTIDFLAAVKAASTTGVLKSDDQADLKTQILANSRADIYVEAELDLNEGAGGNACRVILQAYDVGTAGSLANMIGESGKFMTDDWGKLCMRGASDKLEPFLNTMQAKFGDVVANGRSVVLDITIQTGAAYNFSQEVGAEKDELRDAITDWVEENAFKNNAHVQGTTELRMIFDDVRIPLKDPTTGNNYNPDRFARELVRFLRGLNLAADRTIKGNTILISMK